MKAMKIKITYNNKTTIYPSPVTVKDVVGDDKNIICAQVNHKIKELTELIENDSVIETLTLKDRDAKSVYDASLRFLVSMSCHSLWPGKEIAFSYYISRCIYLEFVDEKMAFDDKNTALLEAKMNEFVRKDLPFKRIKCDIQEMANIYKKVGQNEKVEILKYRPEDHCHYYECNHYLNYMYDRMVPSTGYISKWKLLPYHRGVLIQYPRFDNNGLIPKFEDSPIYSQTINEARRWGKIIKADSIFNINKYIDEGKIIDLINLSESRHNKQLQELGDIIEQKKNKIRLICIAGPSSSGKTTFANRLRIELMSRGINPVRLSLDDYYKERVNMPDDPDGGKDFESIEAYDVNLFNTQMEKLIHGEEVTLPSYSFITGKKTFTKKLKLTGGETLIVEGIHALNDLMTKNIPDEYKYKIFISPEAQVKIDHEDPLSITDLRLLRRIVRDYKFRDSPIQYTLELWPKVRRGEFTWIYKTQEVADYVFNSYLPYELGSMKKYAMPLLLSVKEDDIYYPITVRLIKMLRYFREIPDDWVPCNSIFREFIGGSCYQDV